MSLVVKAQSASDLSKPPFYTQVADEEVILKGRESRLDKPEVYYHQSPKVSTVDETLPFESQRSQSVDSVSPRNRLSGLFNTLHVTSRDNTATEHVLGTSDLSATASAVVEYREQPSDTAASDTDTSNPTSSPTTSVYTSPMQAPAAAAAASVDLHPSALQPLAPLASFSEEQKQSPQPHKQPQNNNVTNRIPSRHPNHSYRWLTTFPYKYRLICLVITYRSTHRPTHWIRALIRHWSTHYRQADTTQTLKLKWRVARTAFAPRNSGGRLQRTQRCGCVILTTIVLISSSQMTK